MRSKYVVYFVFSVFNTTLSHGARAVDAIKTFEEVVRLGNQSLETSQQVNQSLQEIMTRVSYNKLSLEGFYSLQNRRYFSRPLPCACLALHARVEVCSPEKREIIPSVLQATFKPNPEMPHLGEKDEQSLKVTAMAEKINKSISIQRKANRELQK